MAKNLKIGERVTVDRTVDFGTDSEPFKQGLERVESGQLGVVVSPAPQGRASIVDFNGIQATLSNQRIMRIAEKPTGNKRGRKKKVVPTSEASAPPKLKRATRTPKTVVDDTSAQLITMVANTLLLNGGLKDADAVIQLRFTELPKHVQTQIHALIQAKLALSGSALKK